MKLCNKKNIIIIIVIILALLPSNIFEKEFILLKNKIK